MKDEHDRPMQPLIRGLPAWDRGVVVYGVISAVVVGASAVTEAAVGGWGTVTGWTLIGTSVLLVGLALASLVRRLSRPDARTWTGVWVPLGFVALNVGLVVAVFAVQRALQT